jgi:hypothetical protein
MTMESRPNTTPIRIRTKMNSNDNLKALIRAAGKRRTLGTAQKCASCEETDPRCLRRVGDVVLCSECENTQTGRARVERHHVAGQHNLPDTVPIPGNDHRVLSDAQVNWPKETLRNPDGSPVLKAAAALRGWLDVLRLIIDRTVGWIPEFLERLDAWLREHVGPRYWTLPGFPESMGGEAA